MEKEMHIETINEVKRYMENKDYQGLLLSIPKCTIWVKYFCTKMYIFILSFLYNYIFSLII